MVAPLRFAVETHGCRLNQAEGDAIVEQLQLRGHEPAAIEDADLYVLNSCAITHGADADARAAIRRARRRNPDARVVITGCHATAAADALAKMPELDAVIGNVEKRGDQLLALLEGVAGREGAHERAGETLVAAERLTRKLRPRPWALTPARSPARTRPLLEVQDGCDHQCSFCIVPSVRGRSRSAPAKLASEQLAGLLAAGAPEVVLTGAHLGSWGRELGPRARAEGLAGLLARLLADNPGARLRLGSVDPHEVDDALIDQLARGVDADGAGLCAHLHLPVQSGDDRVLKAMRRAHRVADLERLVPRLRAAAPGIGLGTDVIVGFPGEDDAAFEHTLELFRTTALPFAHVFVWSPRAGTPAASLGDRVASDLAARRSQLLRRQVEQNARRFLAEQDGRERSAVVLRRRHRSGSLVALTDNYLRVRVDGTDDLLGRRVWVRVEIGAQAERARGRVVG